jgi:hypothetical protein
MTRRGLKFYGEGSDNTSKCREILSAKIMKSTMILEVNIKALVPPKRL